MRVVLPGVSGEGLNETYYIRVSSENGLTNGEYQLQVRLRQVDEKPGSIVQHADIRFATNGIEVIGLPFHSPLLGEVGETGANNNTIGAAQQLGNILDSDRTTFSIGGNLSGGDVDFYEFSADHQIFENGADSLQSIPGIADEGLLWSTVIDVDYADGFGRADSTAVVYQQDSAGNWIPVLIGRESNIASDQPAPGQGIDVDDLTRGSAGQLV